jgi:hypothetical protein
MGVQAQYGCWLSDTNQALVAGIPALDSVLIMMLIGFRASLCVPPVWKAARS